jgi:hypothetical protein
MHKRDYLCNIVLERANPKGKRSMKDKVKREKPRIDGQDKCRIKTKGESASGNR